MKNIPCIITQAAIAAGDIHNPIYPLDPKHLPPAAVCRLHGKVRLRVQQAAGPAEVFLQPAARKYFRALHAKWPYAGYFFKLKPITQDSPVEQITDVTTFMSLALCHCDDLGYYESPQGIGLRFSAGQLAQILVEFQGRAIELGQTVGLRAAAIRQRDSLITEAVASFFDCGQPLAPPNPATE